MSDVLDAHLQFYAALKANLSGDTAPMHAIWSREDDVTSMGPFGGCLEGPTAVLGQFDTESTMGMGGQVVPMDVRVARGVDMGVVSCIETGEGMWAADGSPIEFALRSTNVYRLEDGAWKIIHHHTDDAPH